MNFSEWRQKKTSTIFTPFPLLACLSVSSMFDQAVPGVWQSKGYPSLKPLGPWYQDLLGRLGFMSSWVDHGIPPVRRSETRCP